MSECLKITFSNPILRFSSEQEFNDYIHNTVDSGLLDSFKELRFKSSIKNSVDPTPVVTVNNSIISIVWQGKELKRFKQDFYESRVFYKIKKYLLNAGWIIDISIVNQEPQHLNFDSLFEDTSLIHNCIKIDNFGNPINYHLNSRQYRCKEFETIDWANSIVIFGCSTSFNIGVDEKYSIHSVLSDMTGLPVINLSIPGTSIEFSVDNQILLSANFPRPKAVINIWTHYLRTVKYYHYGIRNIGPWNIEHYIDPTETELSHIENKSKLSVLTARQLWKDIPHFEGTYYQETSSVLNVELLPLIDFSVSKNHPGIKSVEKSCEIILNRINL